MITHGSQLFWFVVFCIRGVVNGLGRPDTNVAICEGSTYKSRNDAIECERTTSRGDQTLAVWRDMTAVNFEIFLFAWLDDIC